MFSTSSKEEAALRSASDNIHEGANRIKDDARKTMGGVKGNIDELAHDAGQRVHDMAHEAKKTVMETMHEKPVQTLLSTLAAGFILGLIFRR